MGVVCEMAELEQRAAANNTLGLFIEDIVENILRDIDDEEALAELRHIYSAFTVCRQLTCVFVLSSDYLVRTTFR